ncbi:hypothetical protein DCAR_0312884 [Daucus carota subsp. sativus]|uniref:Zinc finger PHD-type domain-containing protein n=2 Tax=Daucus carota subsp. sativus TaxID=79200 RepID=A0AAF1ASH1_DAUCS|nr:hypothetical protein DCAR_0312884 [Daucus carota subsp. sativus]
MGKLDHDTQILHFTHPHPLVLNSNDQFTLPDMSSSNVNPVRTTCAGCKLPANSSDDLIYSCNRCNYHLHLFCTKFPQLITHPSHTSHPLVLLPVSTYPEGLFNCDACLRRGEGFSYHCNTCDFDLHVVCAAKPLTVVHQLHEHPLMLTFKNPYETKGFACDVCSKIGSKHWLYRCGVCEFDAHLHCATGSLPPPVPPLTVERNQFHEQPKPEGPSSGNSSRLQGNQNFPAMSNNPGNRITGGIQTQQNVPETTSFQYTGVGIQMQQGPPGNYYNSRMQRQQNSPVTTGGGMPPQQGYPGTLGGVMQRQQSYPLTGVQHQNYPVTGAGGMQPRQSYEVTGAGGMPPQQSYQVTGAGGMPRHQSYQVTGAGGMPPPQSYQVTGVGEMQPQQTYPSATGGLMNAALQGLVEGAAQQVGQNLMQGLMGGVGGDGATSSVYVNLGSTYTDNQDSGGAQEY